MSVDRERFDEVWIQSPTGDSMMALINGDRGFLMLVDTKSGASRTSRNPDYAGNTDSLIEYQLSNGQIDEYPESWALPIKAVRRALKDFEQSHVAPAYIDWHIDG